MDMTFEENWLDDFGVDYERFKRICWGVATKASQAWKIPNEREDLFMLCQDHFVKEYDDIKNDYDPERGNFSSYLYKRLLNQAYKHLEKMVKEFDAHYGFELPETPLDTLMSKEESEIIEEELASDEINSTIVKLLEANFTYEAIAHELDKMGLTHPAGRVWSKQRVSEIVLDMREEYPDMERHISKRKGEPKKLTYKESLEYHRQQILKGNKDLYDKVYGDTTNRPTFDEFLLYMHENDQDYLDWLLKKNEEN